MTYYQRLWGQVRQLEQELTEAGRYTDPMPTSKIIDLDDLTGYRDHLYDELYPYGSNENDENPPL